MENQAQEAFLAGSDSESEDESREIEPSLSSSVIDQDQEEQETESATEESSSSEEEESIVQDYSHVRTPLDMTDPELRQIGLVRLPLVTNVKGKIIDTVVGPSLHSNTIIWLVKFTDNSNFDLVHGRLMNIYFHNYVTNYYETRIKWLPGTIKYKYRKMKNFIVDLSNCPAKLIFEGCMKAAEAAKKAAKRRRIEYK